MLSVIAFFLLHIVSVCACPHTHMLPCICRGQRTASGGVGIIWLSPSIWGSNSVHQMTTAFTCWAIILEVSLCSSSSPGVHYVDQPSLELTASRLPLPSKFWDWRYLPPWLDAEPSCWPLIGTCCPGGKYFLWNGEKCDWTVHMDGGLWKWC